MSLSLAQRAALDKMDEYDAGAVLIGSLYGMRHGPHGAPDSWAFKVDVREGTPSRTGDDVALAVLAVLKDPGACEVRDNERADDCGGRA